MRYLVWLLIFGSGVCAGWIGLAARNHVDGTAQQLEPSA
jgi:hypothetical protein